MIYKAHTYPKCNFDRRQCINLTLKSLQAIDLSYIYYIRDKKYITLKFKNRVIFLAVKVRMRPMGHIVDLYISEILNSSVSRHITKVGGGGRTGHVFKDIFRNVNMPLMATPTHTSFMNSTGFFFFNVCIRYASYRVWYASRKGRFAVFSHGRRFDKNSCMVCERLYANFK